MPQPLTDEEMETLEDGTETEIEEPKTAEVEDTEIEEEETPPEPVVAAPNPLDGMVPVAQYARLQAQLEQQSQILQTLAQRGSPAPAAPSAPSYVRPGEPVDVQKWRGFVGETADPVVEAKVRAAVGPIQEQILMVADMQDEVKTRALIASKADDYDEYAQDIEALRAQWRQATGNLAPRMYAYHVVKGMRAMEQERPKARKAAVQRVAASATAAAAPPARAKPKVGKGPVTLQDVKKMNLKELEAHALNAKF